MPTKDLNENHKRLSKSQFFNEARFVREVARNYAEAYDAITRRIERLYEKYAKEGELTHAEMTKFNRLTKLEKQMTEDLRPAHISNRAIMDRAARVQYEEGFYRYAWAMDQALEVQLNWGTLNPEAVKAAVSNPFEKIAKDTLPQDIRGKLRREITQGIVRGESYAKMRRRIQKVQEYSTGQAARIIRTEGQKAQVLGQKSAFNKARTQQVDVREFWDATLDLRTRPAHGRMDGKEAKMRNGQFQFYSSDVGWVSAPLQSGVASFDINCRCRVRPQIADAGPVVRRSREDGVIPYTTYEQWAKQKGINTAA